MTPGENWKGTTTYRATVWRDDQRGNARIIASLSLEDGSDHIGINVPGQVLDWIEAGLLAKRIEEARAFIDQT